MIKHLVFTTRSIQKYLISNKYLRQCIIQKQKSVKRNNKITEQIVS